MPSRTIHLSDEGLREGDAIDSYFDDFFRSGNEVIIPDGSYQWGGDGLDGSQGDAALRAPNGATLNFTGAYWNVNVLASGDVTLQNITIRGALHSDDNKSRFRFDARDADATVLLDNFNLPDGEDGNGRAIGVYVGTRHEGHVHLRDCHIEGWPNNGLYHDDSNGRVTVDHCFFKNNNIDAVRLGGDGDTIRDTVIVQNEVPAYYNGAESGRGVRVRYPGQDITVENVHITSSCSTPFLVTDRAGSPSGTVRDLFIENNTRGVAAFAEVGDWTATNVHVTGSGGHNVTGFASAQNVLTGGDATPPAKDLTELDGGSVPVPGAEPEPDPAPTPEPKPPGTKFLIREATGSALAAYRFETDGTVAFAAESANEANDLITNYPERAVVKGETGSGHADGFYVDGAVTALEVDGAVELEWAGAAVTADELLPEPAPAPEPVPEPTPSQGLTDAQRSEVMDEIEALRADLEAYIERVEDDAGTQFAQLYTDLEMMVDKAVASAVAEDGK